MSIREAVERAMERARVNECQREPECDCHSECKYQITAAITAFLEAAATIPDKDGRVWHMRPDEATEEMGKKSGLVDKCVCGCRITQWGVKSYRAMNAAAPKFEWDK